MSLAIIQPMQFELVKAAMATMLAAERDAQLAKLVTAGKTDDEISNFYDYNVFKNRFRFPDTSELPAINIRNHSGKFGVGDGKNYLDSKWHSYLLSIECYSVSTAEPNASADELAAARLDYLFSQAWNTFEAETNFHKGLRSIVRRAGFLEWKQLAVDDNDSSAECIIAIQGIYELQFEEPTEMMTGEDFEELVASLEIDSQFIDPFVTVQK